MRTLFRRKPWLWIVLLLGAMVATEVAFLVVALRHPVESVAGP